MPISCRPSPAAVYIYLSYNAAGPILNNGRTTGEQRQLVSEQRTNRGKPPDLTGRKRLKFKLRQVMNRSMA